MSLIRIACLTSLKREWKIVNPKLLNAKFVRAKPSTRIMDTSRPTALTARTVPSTVPEEFQKKSPCFRTARVNECFQCLTMLSRDLRNMPRLPWGWDQYLESSYENDNLPTVRLKPRHTDCPISQHEGEAQSEALRHMHLYWFLTIFLLKNEQLHRWKGFSWCQWQFFEIKSGLRTYSRRVWTALFVGSS